MANCSLFDYGVVYLAEQYSHTLQFGFDDALQGPLRVWTIGEHLNLQVSTACTYMRSWHHFLGAS